MTLLTCIQIHSTVPLPCFCFLTWLLYQHRPQTSGWSLLQGPPQITSKAKAGCEVCRHSFWLVTGDFFFFSFSWWIKSLGCIEASISSSCNLFTLSTTVVLSNSHFCCQCIVCNASVNMSAMFFFPSFLFCFVLFFFIFSKRFSNTQSCYAAPNKIQNYLCKISSSFWWTVDLRIICNKI